MTRGMRNCMKHVMGADMLHVGIGDHKLWNYLIILSIYIDMAWLLFTRTMLLHSQVY